LAPDALQDLTAVNARQHQVKNDQVIREGLGQLQAFFPVSSDVYSVTLGNQSAADESRDLWFIFDQKNPHLGTSNAPPRTQCLFSAPTLEKADDGFASSPPPGMPADTGNFISFIALSSDRAISRCEQF
jgi:hypothetical protein